MTLSTLSSRITYVASGVVSSFPIPFKIWAASNLGVYLRDPSSQIDTKLTFGINYTTDIAIYPNTGNVIFVAAPLAGMIVVIEREMPLTQELDLIASGDFAAENIEMQLDKIVAEIQTLRDILARAPLLPVGSPILNMPLPDVGAGLAGDLLGLDATGLAWAFYAGVTQSAVPVSSYASTLLDDANAAAARATLGILGGTFTADFASTADNAVSAALSFGVAGARVGDLCLASGSAGTLLTTVGISLLAKCVANDAVQVVMVNDSGATLDPVSQSINIIVIPHF